MAEQPPRPLRRRAVLRAVPALATTGLLASCGASRATGGGDAAAPTRTQLSWLKTVTFAGYYVAEEKGLFEREGLRETLLSGGPSIPDVVSPTAVGAADVSLADLPSLLKARADGADLVALGAVFQESPSGFVSLASRPVRTAQDLVGRRIGLSPGSEVFLEALLKLNGLPVRYERVPVGSGTAALVQGKCEVMACYITSQPIQLKAQGHDVVTVSQGRLGMPDYALLIVARQADIRRARSRYVGYLRAVSEGYRRNLDAPDLGTRLTVEKYGKALGLDRSATAAENDVQNRLVRSAYTDTHGLCAIDRDRLAGPIYDGLRARGLTGLPPVRTILDGSLLAEAHA